MKIVNTLEKIIDEEVDFYGNKAKNIWIILDYSRLSRESG